MLICLCNDTICPSSLRARGASMFTNPNRSSLPPRRSTRATRSTISCESFGHCVLPSTAVLSWSNVLKSSHPSASTSCTCAERIMSRVSFDTALTSSWSVLAPGMLMP